MQKARVKDQTQFATMPGNSSVLYIPLPIANWKQNVRCSASDRKLITGRMWALSIAQSKCQVICFASEWKMLPRYAGLWEFKTSEMITVCLMGKNLCQTDWLQFSRNFRLFSKQQFVKEHLYIVMCFSLKRKMLLNCIFFVDSTTQDVKFPREM